MFAHKKITIAVLAGLAVLCVLVFRSGGNTVANIETVQYTDLSRVVRATGQVVSKTDLNLSFNKPGIVKSVRVAVGDRAEKGQILATLDQGQALATLTQAKAAVLSAEAQYDKIVEGASTEEVALAEVLLKNAETDLSNTKNTQNALVSNAYRALLNSYPAAFSSSDSLWNTQSAPVISGTYAGDVEGAMYITVYQGGNSGYFSVSGLVDGSGIVSATTPQPIGNSGLYILFASDAAQQGKWTVSIPNTKASNYLANYNAYKSAMETRISAVAVGESLVAQRRAELDLKKASARRTDVDIARAEVLSAEGSLQSAQSAYEDTVIRAPASGMITRVDTKYGELAEGGKAILILQDVQNLYIEALINEANIVHLKVGQSATVTFDAFGSEKSFVGTVAHIDPSAEVNDGVVNYKIRVVLNENDETIRPGMNANVSVLSGEAKQVLAIPRVAVSKKNNASFVRVAKDDAGKHYEDREVVTGFVGDNNFVEIISGLFAGERVALLEDK